MESRLINGVTGALPHIPLDEIVGIGNLFSMIDRVDESWHVL